MWIYKQSTGSILDSTGIVGTGYSGHGLGKNDPQSEHIKDFGPIPRGFYHIQTLIIETSIHGPYVLTLVPATGNMMFGRAGFLIHGDSIEHPGDASKGCIILNRKIRELIWNSGNRDLQVVA